MFLEKIIYKYRNFSLTLNTWSICAREIILRVQKVLIVLILKGQQRKCYLNFRSVDET